jgi:isoleucyl-tRNA synthetase
VHWLAPILSFTAEEAYLHYHGRDLSDREISVHLNTMPEVKAEWQNDLLSARFESIWDVRRVVNGALERKREEKIIGKSLEAEVTIFVTDEETAALLREVDFADIAIVSRVTVKHVASLAEGYSLDDVAGVAVVVTKSAEKKCNRCWKQLPDVGINPHYPEICGRCATVIAA